MLTRRKFLSTLLGGTATALAAQSVLDYFAGEGNLLAEAAELAREVVTVDLHCHPNLLRGSTFPGLEPDVPKNMRSGGVDAGVFAARGDYPVIGRDSSGRRYESRAPKKGELFERTQRQLDGVAEAIATQQLAIVHSPAEIINAKKDAKPCVVLAIEGSARGRSLPC